MNDSIDQLRCLKGNNSIGVVAQLVERLICIQEAWGSTPHNSIFFLFSIFYLLINSHIQSLFH